MSILAESPRPRWRPWLPFALVGTAVALTMSAYLRFGLSLQGLAILVPVAMVLLAGLLWLSPVVLATVAPMMLPLPAVWILFPYEFVFGLLALLVVLDGLRTRANWMWTLSRQEVWHLALCLWGAFSVFWIFDETWFVHGVRRLWIGLVTFWVARRMAGRIPVRAFERGLVLGAISLAMAALIKRLSVGMSEEQAAQHRAEVTDLGWGTANYIATLLLLLSPMVLEVARRGRGATRALAWAGTGLIAYMQGVIASRAAGVLWATGTAMQVVGRRSRAGFVTILGVALGLILFLVSPLGQAIVFRFTSPRELGSMAVRVWYWRVAWQRIVDHFPWGMGLNQGWAYPDRLNNVDPHNYWLAMAFELGVPGVVLWLGVLVLLWRRLCAMAADPEFRDMGRALQIVFWLGMLHTLVEPTFQGPQYQFMFFWIMGGGLGYFEKAASERLSPSTSR